MGWRRGRDDEDGPGDLDDAHAHDGFEYEEHEPRSTAWKVAGCMVPVVLLSAVAGGGYYAYRHLENYFGQQSCRLVDGDAEEKLDPEQAANAATIVTVGTVTDRLPTAAAHIAVTTSIQESKLRNLTYGDRDSLGLFQQRPSMGWGTAEQISDPVYSSRAFYAKLVKIPDWQSRPLTEVAQQVQKSGHPDAYADHEGEGRTMTHALAGRDGTTIGCRIDPATSASSPEDLRDKLRDQTGLPVKASGNGVTTSARTPTEARAVGAWAVTHAEFEGISRVTVGTRQWERQRGRDGWSWQDADSPTSSDTQVRVELTSGVPRSSG